MQFIIYTIFAASAIAYLMVIWFKTNVVIEYAELLGLGKLVQAEDYRKMSADDPEMTYPKFLALTKDNFLTRLVSCPKCLVAWLSGISTMPCYYLYGTLGFVISFPLSAAIAYVSLYLYFKLVNLMET